MLGKGEIDFIYTIWEYQVELWKPLLYAWCEVMSERTLCPEECVNAANFYKLQGNPIPILSTQRQRMENIKAIAHI